MLKIQLIGSGKFLVLKPGSSVTVETHTTLFNSQGDYLSSFSYPGEMELEPNRALLQNAHYVHSDSSKRTIWVRTWLGDKPWKLCKLNFSIQDDTVQYVLYLDTTLINNQLSSLTLDKLYVTGKSTQVNTTLLNGMAQFMEDTCVSNSPLTFNYTSFITGYFLQATNGQPYAYAGAMISDFILLDKNTSTAKFSSASFMSSNIAFVCFYDGSKNYISHGPVGDNNVTSYTNQPITPIPNNAVYFRVTVHTTGTPASALSWTISKQIYPMVFFPFKDDGAYKDIDKGVVIAYQGTWNASTNTPTLHNATPLAPSTAVAGWVYKVSVAGSQDFGGGPINFAVGDYVILDGANWSNTDNPYGIPDSAYPDLIFPYSNIINRWEMDNTGAGSFRVDPGGKIKETQVPFFYVTTVLQRIADYFGFVLSGTVLNQSWFQAIVIWSRVAVSYTGIIADLPYFMPNVTVSDFLKELRTVFGVRADFDMTNMIMNVDALNNLVKTSDTVDLRDAQIRSYRDTPVAKTYYLVSQSPDPDDGAFTQGETLPTLQIGSPDTSDTVTNISMISVPTTMIVEPAAVDLLLTSPISANWRIPYIKQAIAPQTPMDQVSALGNSGDINSFKLRFLIWNGMQPNANGFLYPYGSIDNIPSMGDPASTLTLSLTAGSSDFLPIRYYYNFMLNSKPAEWGMIFKPAQLATITASKRIIVNDPWNFAAVSALMDILTTDLVEGQETCGSKITLYPVIWPNNTQQIDVVAVIPPVTPPDNGVVYVRLILDNETEVIETHPTEANTFYEDVTAYFYEDAAGTVPKNVNSLPVSLKTAETVNNSSGITEYDGYSTFTCSGTNARLLTGAPVNENFTDGSGDSIIWQYSIQPSAYYTVID